jgi:uncharacterized protein (TIGR02646 family)
MPARLLRRRWAGSTCLVMLMKKLDRHPISDHARRTLARRQALVDNDADPRARANKLWRQRNNRAFEEIRRVLNHMATGRSRCMYCEDSEGTDIEHFYPKTAYAERAFFWSNYLLACSGCNSNYKRGQFPLDVANQPMMIDPTADDPAEHLSLTPTTGRWVALTERGERSIEICGMNRVTLNQGRRDAWATLCALIPAYVAYRRRGEIEQAEELRDTVRRFPFSSVLWHLVRTCCLPGAHRVVSDDVLVALD